MNILEYLNGPHVKDGHEYKSPYMAALIDARNSTGRDLVTGEIVNADLTGNWPGAISYLILIDHIGYFFCRKDINVQGKNSFVSALQGFTDLNEKEIFALYALRCAFAHKYSLIHIGKGSKADLLHHHFTVRGGKYAPLMYLPEITWDGKIENRTRDNITTISLEAVGNLVEGIHKKLISFAESNNLEFLNKDELIYITYPL